MQGEGITMFFGSIPADVQTIMANNIKEWNCTDIYVGCSGNFTVEKVISPLKKFTLHSNDVTLYSYCLGKYLSEEYFNLYLTKECHEKIPWTEEYLKNPVDCLATIMLMSSIVRYMDKDNPYYLRMYDAYVKQFSTLHSQTVAKIENNETKLASYFNGDAMQFVKDTPEDAGFVTYPTFKNAGKAYIKDFAKLETLFHFEPTEYTIFDENTLLEYFKLVASKRYWIIGTDMKLPELFDAYLKALSKTTNRGITIYIYSNAGKTHYIGPRQEIEDLKIPRLMPGDTVGDKIELKILSNNAFQTLRSEYMNINIRPGAATLAVGVFVDEKLCGVYAFSAAPTQSNWDTHIDTPTIYLLSDFPVEPVDYDRLAKLVLYAALSEESKLLAERITRKRVKSLVTTAFSKNPVSMKYRGLFKVLNRKEHDALGEDWAKDIDPSNAYYAQKYQINYGAKMGEWTLDEGLQLWKKKHSQKTGKKENI